jgi:aminobenzoyl-glutamate utilization protein B
LARGIQREPPEESARPLLRAQDLLGTPPREQDLAAAKRDIGDISWNVPTITLRFRRTSPPRVNGPTPFRWPRHRTRVTAGAKAVAMTVIDLMLADRLTQADYFNNADEDDQVFP